MQYIKIDSREFHGYGPKECRTCPHLDMYESDCGIMSKMLIPGWEDGREGFPVNFFDRCPFIRESATKSSAQVRTLIFRRNK